MSEDRGRRANRPDSGHLSSAANDNAQAGGDAIAVPAMAAVGDPPPAGAVPANDNHRSIVLSAANDNDIIVSDDLPRPIPYKRGEGEIVRILLGAYFREILFDEE